jgi:hypothetical protein
MSRAKNARLRQLALLVPLTLLATGLASAAAATSAAPSSSTVPNLVKNGNFSIPKSFSEANVAPGSGYAIPGWTIAPTGVQDLASSYYKMPGTYKQAVKLHLSAPGWVSQTIATVPGTTYQLHWYGAAETSGPATQQIHVLWNGSVVASPNFSASGSGKVCGVAGGCPATWTQEKTIVTATSTSSTLEFAESTTPANATTEGPLVTGVTLAGYASLYLPATVNVTPTGKIIAVVRNGTNTTLNVGGLTVTLYGKTKTVSYAPAVTELLATAPVAKGQATLQLHLAASLKGQTVAAYAILKGPEYLPVTVNLKLKVS